MIKRLLKRNVFILMSGTLFAQLLPFLISPILTRIFTPQQFGEFGLYFSITMICSVFITARYEMAIMLPKEEHEAENLVGLSILITCIISCVLLVLILFFKQSIALLFKTPAIENWLLFIPISLFSIGIYQALNYWNNRNEKYKSIAFSRVARSAATSFWSIIFGFSGLKKGGLILGDTLGQLLSMFFLFQRTKKDYPIFLKSVNKAEIKKQAVRYKQFPIYNVSSGMLEKLSGHSPVMYLAHFFNESITGFFSFSLRIISAPSTIVARAFGDIFRQKATKIYNEQGNCKKLFKKTFFQLLMLSLIPFSLFYFVAPDLFALVFGEKWYQAGKFAQVLTPMFFLQFLVSPLSNMFLIAEKQNIDLIMQVSLFIFVSCSFLFGYKYYNNPETCLFLFTFTYSLKYLVELVLSYQFSLGKK